MQANHLVYIGIDFGGKNLPDRATCKKQLCQVCVPEGVVQVQQVLEQVREVEHDEQPLVQVLYNSPLVRHCAVVMVCSDPFHLN
jgi:hypothetical protein